MRKLEQETLWSFGGNVKAELSPDDAVIGVVKGMTAFPGHLFRIRLESDGRMSHFEVKAPDGAAITAETLRAYPLGVIRQQVLARAAQLHNVRAGKPTERMAPVPDDLRSLQLARRMRDYVRACSAGGPNPVARYADEIGKSVRTVQSWRQQAEAEGLFIGAGKAVAGGRLTDIGAAVLRLHGEEVT
jgi:hypothetical protein